MSDAPPLAHEPTPATKPKGSRLSFSLASPIPHSPSLPALTPLAETDRSTWLDVGASASGFASTRTSISRVDATRVGTPEPHLAEPPHSPPSPVAESLEPIAAFSSEAPSQVPQTPQATLQFLTVSGSRRIMSFDPDAAISRVKELVWSAWPSDWTDERPPAPGYLRILHLGRILNDDDTLSKLNIPVHPPATGATGPPPAPTVVHLSIRPIAPPGEEDGKKSRRKASTSSAVDDPETHSGCCGCIIA